MWLTIQLWHSYYGNLIHIDDLAAHVIECEEEKGCQNPITAYPVWLEVSVSLLLVSFTHAPSEAMPTTETFI